MIPYVPWVLWEIGDFRVEYFHVLVAVAVFVGHRIAMRQGIRMGLDPLDVRFVNTRMVIGGFVVAHLVAVLAYHPDRALKDPWILLRFWSGLSSVGGILGAALTFAWVTRREQLPALALADAVALGLAPAWTIGRLGCFMAHDHPGYKTSFLLAVTYPAGPRHDFGLYEALATALITFMLYRYARTLRGPGALIGFLAVAYALTRFLLDSLGRPDPRYVGLTLAQWACLVCFGLGLWLVRGAPYQDAFTSPTNPNPGLDINGFSRPDQSSCVVSGNESEAYG